MRHPPAPCKRVFRIARVCRQWYNRNMKWQDYLTDDERASLAVAEEQRARARERWNALVRQVKAKAEWRMKKPDAGGGE
jgi:hypothetical protein